MKLCRLQRALLIFHQNPAKGLLPKKLACYTLHAFLPGRVKLLGRLITIPFPSPVVKHSLITYPHISATTPEAQIYPSDTLAFWEMERRGASWNTLHIIREHIMAMHVSKRCLRVCHVPEIIAHEIEGVGRHEPIHLCYL